MESLRNLALVTKTTKNFALTFGTEITRHHILQDFIISIHMFSIWIYHFHTQAYVLRSAFFGKACSSFSIKNLRHVILKPCLPHKVYKRICGPRVQMRK